MFLTHLVSCQIVFHRPIVFFGTYIIDFWPRGIGKLAPHPRVWEPGPAQARGRGDPSPGCRPGSLCTPQWQMGACPLLESANRHASGRARTWVSSSRGRRSRTVLFSYNVRQAQVALQQGIPGNREATPARTVGLARPRQISSGTLRALVFRSFSSE